MMIETGKITNPRIILGCFWLLVLSISCSQSSSSDLTIATSANMQFAMEDIVDAFEQEYGTHCQAVVSSSGKLTAQISSGAPYDIFFSADKKYPEQLYQQGLTIDTPSIYAFGNLALWSMSLNEKALSNLSTANLDRIAIANPATAPYGQAARQMLDHYNYPDIEEKLVFGESISQVNQFVSSEVVDVGVTSLSVVLSPILKDKGYWIRVEAESYQPIAQSMVVVSKSQEKIKSALLFKKFISSAKAQSILEQYGFTL